MALCTIVLILVSMLLVEFGEFDAESNEYLSWQKRDDQRKTMTRFMKVTVHITRELAIKRVSKSKRRKLH